tara:strand:+ start:39 stop:215 length:177 start_codon:yes stop_codon:yes gene_type:complete
VEASKSVFPHLKIIDIFLIIKDLRSMLDKTYWIHILSKDTKEVYICRHIASNADPSKI